jgi:hypothetical protein
VVEWRMLHAIMVGIAAAYFIYLVKDYLASHD